MPSAANFLATASYWSDRVREEGKAEGYDWLLGGSDAGLKSFIKDTVNLFYRASTPNETNLTTIFSSPPSSSTRILHLGPGSSLLSLWLRDLVASPRLVTHFDFADSAADLGRRWERERWPGESEERMHWFTGDLLHLDDVLGLPDQVREAESAMAATRDDVPSPNLSSSPAMFDVLIDKGTLDAISCAEDRQASASLTKRILAYDSDFGNKSLKQSLTSSLTVALHLASIARPGAAWIMLSYSGTRFDAFSARVREGTPQSIEELASRLWRLEIRRELHETVEEGAEAGRGFHWLYLLRRTDVTF